jgi:hypothetical protein
MKKPSRTQILMTDRQAGSQWSELRTGTRYGRNYRYGTSLSETTTTTTRRTLTRLILQKLHEDVVPTT